MATPPYEPLFEREGVTVSRSPWGPADNIGRLNLMTAQSRQAALARADGSRVFDLAVEYFLGMPSWSAAGDPTYQMWMTHTPGGSMNDRSSGATTISSEARASAERSSSSPRSSAASSPPCSG